MRAALGLASSLVLVGCATVPAQRIRFEDAWTSGDRSALSRGDELDLAEAQARGTQPKRAAFLRLRWPVDPVVVTSPYGHRVHPIHSDYRFHAGVDLEAAEAQPVRAAEAGTVVFSGWNGAHGNQIELQHRGRVATRYSHLQTVLVAPGQRVKKGAVLGLAGDTGDTTGHHLHFELLRDGMAVDPELVLPASPGLGPLVWR